MESHQRGVYCVRAWPESVSTFIMKTYTRANGFSRLGSAPSLIQIKTAPGNRATRTFVSSAGADITRYSYHAAANRCPKCFLLFIKSS